MSSTIAGLAEEFCAAINAGELDWDDYRFLRYDYGSLLETFQERIKDEGTDFAKILGSYDLGWSADRINAFIEQAAVPSNDELALWASSNAIDPIFLVLVPLTKGSESHGFAIISGPVPHGGDDRRLFQVESTFNDKPLAISYLETNWPE